MSASAPNVPDPKPSTVQNAARWAIFLTSLTPIIVSPQFLFPFVTTRNIFFRFCVEIALALVVLAGTKRLRDTEGSIDPILRWFFVYLAAMAVSAVVGLAPWHSLFGDFERMGGVWAWLHLFLFYLVLRAVMRWSDWFILFRAIVVVADAVVAWGAFEFLPDPVRNPLFQTTLTGGSTIGNPGLMAPFLLLSFGACCLLLVNKNERGWRNFARFSALILLFGIAGSQNRSSELGLIGGAIVGTACFFALHRERRRLLRRYMQMGSILISIAIIGGYTLSRRAPNIARHFGGRWIAFVSSPIDHSRTIEWRIALDGFRDRPLTGYGPENHQIVASHHFDPRIYEVVSGENFDRTHNAWLEVLATSGVIGIIGMVGLWIAAGSTLRIGVRQGRILAAEAAILSGALAGYAIYLTFWFFDINSVFIWTALLGFIAFRANGRLDLIAVSETRAAVGPTNRILAWGIIALIFGAAYTHGILPLVAAHELSVATDEGRFEQRLLAFERVMNSTAPQTQHTLPMYYRFLRSSSAFANLPGADSRFRREFDLALERGMIEADRNISRNPADDRSYFQAARLSILAASFYLDSRYLDHARDELLHALRISPKRPDSRVLLSSVYLTLHDSSKANAQLDSAMSLAPQYGGSYFVAARLALVNNELDSASALLGTALKRNFGGNEQLFGVVIDRLEQRGEFLRAARLTQAFLERAYGPFSGWREGNTPVPSRLTPLADDLANRLPLLYLKGGDRTRAARAAIAFAGEKPSAADAVRVFASQIGTGDSSRWNKRTYVLPPSTPVPSTTVNARESGN